MLKGPGFSLVETPLRFSVLADHAQVLLEDDDGGFHDFADAWTSEAAQRTRLAVVPGLVSVGTARDDEIALDVAFVPAAPVLHAEFAEHVVEADLLIASGRLGIHSSDDEPEAWYRVPVEPGLYRLRATYSQRRPASKGTGDNLSYRLELWPVADAAPTTVLKQGPTRWTG